ncbi:MAG: hypothetical protein ABI382_07665 [Nakamurella sp.]
MTLFAPATASDRELATAFVGRVAQLDAAALVRLISRGKAVDLWARGGFGVVATRSVSGRVEPDPLTVYATNLVAALAVSRAVEVDAGSDAPDEWHTQLPPADGWTDVGLLAVTDIMREVRAAKLVAEQAVEIDRENELRAKTKATVPPVVLDQCLMTVETANGRIPISMRMLFALSGMSFVDQTGGSDIRVRVTNTWLRLDSPEGAVARRRMADLPLV